VNQIVVRGAARAEFLIEHVEQDQGGARHVRGAAVGILAGSKPRGRFGRAIPVAKEGDGLGLARVSDAKVVAGEIGDRGAVAVQRDYIKVHHAGLLLQWIDTVHGLQQE
jgi:hypothetical protein